jgi:hypothetical protein
VKRAVVVAALVMLAASPAAVQGQRHDPRYDQAIMNQSINDTLDALEGIAPVPYDANRDALVDVEAALLTASTSGKHVLIIMGGSWCHDSMALWDQFHTPRTAAMLSARYAIAWVDVGYRDRNLQIARRFGLTGIDGTPTVLILRPDGTPTNLEDAPRWRNAASRKPAAIYRTLERAAPAIITP